MGLLKTLVALNMQTLLGSDYTRDIGPNVTVVSPENILNSIYTDHKLKPGQFTLQQPFQRSNPIRRKGRRADRAGSKRAREDEAITSEALTAIDSQQQVPEHIQIIIEAHQQLLHLLDLSDDSPTQQSRQQAAAQSGHDTNRSGAEVAVELPPCPVATLQSTEQQHPTAATSTPSQSTAQPTSQQHAAAANGGTVVSAAQRDAAEAAVQVAEGGTDWLALSAMKHILKPKIRFVHSVSYQIDLKLQQRSQHQSHLNTSHAEQATVSQQQQQEPPNQQQESCNLFNTVVSNPSHTATVAAAYDQEVLLPGRSSFCMCDIKALQPFVQAVQDRGGASLLVIDPPWENASARRSATYNTLTPNHFLYLPVKQLIQQDSGTLIALWMTNRPRLHKFVQQQLLPAWGLQHVATWLWLKVTDAGEAVSPLDSLHRHPFEQLWLLRIQSQDVAGSGSDTAVAEQNLLVQQQQQSRQEKQQQQQQQGRTGQQQQQQEQKKDQEQLQGSLKKLEQQAGTMLPSKAEPSASPTPVPATIAAVTVNLQQDHHVQSDGTVKQPPESHVVISVPGQHSRKPHLGHLLMPYVSKKHQHQHNKQPQELHSICAFDSHAHAPAAGALSDDQLKGGSVMAIKPGVVPGEEGRPVCVELFARELFPGWMSWGNEVIKFQGMEYWTKKVMDEP